MALASEASSDAVSRAGCEGGDVEDRRELSVAFAGEVEEGEAGSVMAEEEVVVAVFGGSNQPVRKSKRAMTRTKRRREQ